MSSRGRGRWRDQVSRSWGREEAEGCSGPAAEQLGWAGT